MEIVVGISIGVIIGILSSAAKKRRAKQPLTPEQKQDITEQVAIIQPIVQDDVRK